MANSKNTVSFTVSPESIREVEWTDKLTGNPRKGYSVSAPCELNGETRFGSILVNKNNVNIDKDKNTATVSISADRPVTVNFNNGKGEDGKNVYVNETIDPKALVIGIRDARNDYRTQKAEERKDKPSVYLDNVSENLVRERTGKDGKKFYSVSIPSADGKGFDSIAVPENFVRPATKAVRDAEGNPVMGEDGKAVREEIPGRFSVYLGKEGDTKKVSTQNENGQWVNETRSVESIRDQFDAAREAYKAKQETAQVQTQAPAVSAPEAQNDGMDDFGQ